MCDLTDSEFIDLLASSVGFEANDGECYEIGLFDRLADLIDPECENGDDDALFSAEQ